MRHVFTLTLALASSVAIASDCPNGDALLKNNTPLAQLCPNGFGQQQHGSIQDAINGQSNNTSMIVASAQQNGVPTDLALAVSYHESEGFNSCAGSPTGVKGPMQLTQQTARGFGFNRDINEQNIQGGMAVLKQAYDKCGASNFACLSAHYNGADAAQQAQWARAVEKADNQLKNDPAMVASACSGGGSSCTVGGGDLAPTTTTTSPGSSPAIASSDVNVASGIV